MSASTDKVFGWIFIIVGVVGILFAFNSAYQVFTGLANPPDIFKLDNFALSIPATANTSAVNATIPLTPEIRKIINMLLYYVFMFFGVSVGGKIASLGILFIKEIKVSSRN